MKTSSAMTTFGFLCGLFGVLYIVCDGIVEAELNASADEFADWVQCRQNATFSELYTLQGGCEEVLNRVGGSTISTANFAARPPIALVVSAHVLEAALVVVFGVLHCWTIYQRRFNADASVSLSVSYKRRRRRHH
ncbi:Hypothetical Protein FCC1311_064272 [Hondaea fermentalgiana]|uniref:Uncharacterized protein n=1 Tax=Hondaea fermentalgiana TaxID=2315210 RepID=A0A2R5GH39_9STRA|nr:Hypothetical Protein FCC1311_064272 [Hondaea fermentalgiana]|eukprot:GBG30207.1 Hypothetical Protein FCC1311_064272 [Hondaea fermentalgiana]